MGLFDDPCPDGIVFDMANRLQGMSRIKNARVKPAPPEMANDVSLFVEILGISHVERIEGFRHGILSQGEADEMDMVVHQAIGPDLQGKFFSI